MKYKWFPGFKAKAKAHAVSYRGKASWLTRLTWSRECKKNTARCEHGMVTACGRVIWCHPEEVKRSYKPEHKCKNCLRKITRNR